MLVGIPVSIKADAATHSTLKHLSVNASLTQLKRSWTHRTFLIAICNSLTTAYRL